MFFLSGLEQRMEAMASWLTLGMLIGLRSPKKVLQSCGLDL